MTGGFTIRDLRKRVSLAGGTLEEDPGYRTMRVFQAVAPDGKRWRANGCVHYRVEFDTQRGAQPAGYNQSEWQRVCEAMTMGLEDIPAEEADQYAED
jgi:hypothetical protein